MIHLTMHVVLLTLVALRRLVVIPGLLLLWGLPLSAIVELAWSPLGVSLGTTISVVASLATFEACVTSSGNMGIVPHRCLSRSVLTILQETWALH